MSYFNEEIAYIDETIFSNLLNLLRFVVDVRANIKRKVLRTNQFGILNQTFCSDYFYTLF